MGNRKRSEISEMKFSTEIKALVLVLFPMSEALL